MTLDDLIINLKIKLLQNSSLEVLFYYFIRNNISKIQELEKSNLTGEVEQIVINSFLNEFTEIGDLERVKKRIENKVYKGLNIYHYLGLYYQDKLHGTNLFDQILKNYFEEHSFKYKYLISKVFDEFETKLINNLKAEIETTNSFVEVLKYIYLEHEINIAKTLENFNKETENLGVIDLLLLEDLKNIKSISYNKIQNQLLEDILWCATEIQSKHKVLNNNEDQYNSNFQSLLKAKGYKTEPQTQRGQSSSKTQYGELDIAIFTKENLPLSIFEAFVIRSIDSDYITKHLKKLSENYDPNGLKNNFAVIYAKSNDFSDMWKRYKDFVPTIDFEYEIVSNNFDDITKEHPDFSGIKLGLTKHNNRENQVNIYHIFMDMNFD